MIRNPSQNGDQTLAQCEWKMPARVDWMKKDSGRNANAARDNSEPQQVASAAYFKFA